MILAAKQFLCDTCASPIVFDSVHPCPNGLRQTVRHHSSIESKLQDTLPGVKFHKLDSAIEECSKLNKTNWAGTRQFNNFTLNGAIRVLDALFDGTLDLATSIGSASEFGF